MLDGYITVMPKGSRDSRAIEGFSQLISYKEMVADEKPAKSLGLCLNSRCIGKQTVAERIKCPGAVYASYFTKNIRTVICPNCDHALFWTNKYYLRNKKILED